MITAEELLKNAPKSARRNYERNIRYKKPSGLINGQLKCDVSAHRLGIRKMSSNGCGAIAVYNALVSTGYDADFNAIALAIDCCALNTFGLFGTAPSKLDKCLKLCRIPAVKAKDYNDFVSVMKAVRVGILCYWTVKPFRSLLHYVTIINQGDHYDVCNRYGNISRPSPVPSIENLCPEECYVCGFFMS